jgi:hypothetical protein
MQYFVALTGMELSPEECTALKDLRGSLNLSLSGAAKLIETHGIAKDKPDPSTIGRWESDGKIGDATGYKNLLAAYQAERLTRRSNQNAAMGKLGVESPTDLSPPGSDVPAAVNRPSRPPLVFGLCAYPDSAIFATVVAGVFGADAVKPIAVKDLASELGSGAIDLAVFNRTSDLPVARIGPKERGNEFDSRTLMRLRGNALAVAGGEGWTTFNQHFANFDERPLPRDLRQLRAMGKVVQDLLDPARDIQATDFHMPGKSSRREAVIELLMLGRKSGVLTGDQFLALDRLISELRVIDDSQSQSGIEAFEQFINALRLPTGHKRRKAAICPTGLTQRIHAEEEGATPLIDCDDLQSLAALDPTQLMDIFFPRNVLVFPYRILEPKAVPLQRLQDSWNDLVSSLRDLSPTNLAGLNAGVDHWMGQAAEGLGAPTKLWTPGTKLIAHVLREQLLELHYWIK